MIEYATYTGIGEKETNEDAVKVFVNQPLATYGFVLADGLGGHGNGDFASKFVVDCVGAAIENTDSVNSTFLDQCFDTAQKLLIREKDKQHLPSVKTTLVILLVTDTIVQWGHIGDSRLYHFRGGKLLSRTFDHSVPQVLALSGQIKESEINHHPDRSVLLRAMGAEWETPEYEISQRNLKMQKGDTFLMCTDGFWEWIDSKTITKILKKNLSAYESLREMKTEVKKNGFGKGMDNYSAVVVNIR